MTNPYKDAPSKAFWKKAISKGWEAESFPGPATLIRNGDKIASAGSCFAANIIPHLQGAGFEYVRTERLPSLFGDLANDNFSYSKFSAAYGNIYTSRQGLQLVQRALGRFTPKESRWVDGPEGIIDPFRPGLRYPASSELEFSVVTKQHLEAVLEAIEQADVFVFTLGLTEAWISTLDGAVFPACPGTIAGTFDATKHQFHNFSAREVTQDLIDMLQAIKEVNPKIRFILTVSPVPLVATATQSHVLLATVYSKSVLRVAASEAEQYLPDAVYFPAYEIVCGPQAPHDFFEADRRQPSAVAINTVMQALFSRCEVTLPKDGTREQPSAAPDIDVKTSAPARVNQEDHIQRFSKLISDASCEEEAQGLR